MSAPSFSSFPPAFGSFPDLEPENNKNASRNTSKKEGEVDTKKDRKVKDPEHDRHKHRKKRSKKTDRHKDGKHKHSHTILYDDELAKGEEDRHARLGARYEGGAPGLFIVDKAGDPMNIVYGGVYAGDIPKYRRAGSGNVLGLERAFKIITRGTGGKTLEIGLNGKRPPARYIDSRSFVLLTTSRTRALIPPSVSKGKGKLNMDVDAQPEYIRLPSRRGRQTDEPLSTYRSIHTAHDSDANSDSEVSSSDQNASSSESDGDDSAPRTAHQHSLAALEASIQQDPTSIPTWLALLNHTLSTVPPSAKTSLARARAEIKLSVLDRAMRTHRANKASVELRIMWLGAGAEVWDAERLEREWEDAVKELGGQANAVEERNKIWEGWLRWRVSSAGKGSRRAIGVEGIIEDAVRASQNVEGEISKVNILWHTAVVLNGAGFSERAMALFQAQAELTFNCVSALASKPLATRLDALEEFWEAELPRVGEPDARGWGAWEREGKPPPPPSVFRQAQTSTDLDMASDAYARWATNEAYLDAQCSMPKRGDDAGDDPYAVILFSDIRQLLVNITTPEAKRAFRIAWLGFLGLHVPGFPTISHADVWSHTHLSRPAFLRRLFPQRDKEKAKGWDAYAGVIVARERKYNPVFSCVKEWDAGVFGPLEGVRGGEGRMWEEADVTDVDKGLVRRLFEQLKRKVVVANEDEDEEWDVMAVAFEAATSLKGALKLSRTLLSSARESLPLWGAHARLECMRGKLDEARKVYDAALSSTPAAALRRCEAALWWAWAEMEWLAGEDERARVVVLRAAQVDPTGNRTMVVLRAKRGLEDRVRTEMSWKEREAWMCLRALLELLIGGISAVEEATTVLENYAQEPGLGGVPRESARARMVLLAWRHANVLGRPLKRGGVREMVMSVVREMESGARVDTVVLGVFLEGEKGESIWGRVRTLTGEGAITAGENQELVLGQKKKGISRRVWEVWLATWEHGRWASEMERVRNSLGVAVGETRTHASPILWRVYIEFEIHCGELKRAKSLLYRAISDCPLVKGLYLLAFGPLRSVFTPRELEGWAETMAERGIRMHRGLEEYAGQREEEIPSDNENESEGEAELEQQSREYRRLAPF